MYDLIISLTTIHSRVHTIHKVINSLLSQDSSLAFEVRLYISEEPYLLDEGIKHIPSELQKLEENNGNKFRIIKTPNIGPYRKFLPLMKDYYDGVIDFSHFITVDDDTVYPQGWLQ